MTPKTFIVMALATCGVALVATLQIKSRSSATQAATASARFLPSFEAEINDVRAVRLAHKDDEFTLQRADDGWGLKEAGGYPVDGAKVSQLLFALKDATTLEQKTANPARHALLGLTAIDAPESEAVQVSITRADESEMTAILVGHQRPTQPGASANESHYVRLSGDDQTWLVRGKLGVDKARSDWLEKEILNIEGERVRSVEIQHADGERVHVAKPDETANDFELLDIPAGKELRYASVAGSLSSGLANLSLEDVVDAGAITFDDPPLAQCTFKTFDGLVLNATLHEADDKLYARFAALYEEPVAAPVETAPAPPELEGAPDSGPSPEAIQAEARDIANKVSAWTYVLPSWKRSTFVKRLDDMLKDVEPAPEEPPLPAIEPELPATADESPETIEEVPLDDETTGVEDADGTGLEDDGSGSHDHDHGTDSGEDG